MGVKNDGVSDRRARKIWRLLGVVCFISPLLMAAPFWFEPLSAALAKEPSATELIADGLPARKTLKNASKQDVLSAICRAVRKRRTFAAAITSAAVAVRHDLGADVVGVVLRCSGKIDCELVGTVVSAAMEADGNAITISDAAIARAPNCAEAIQHATRPHAVNEADRNGRTEASGHSEHPEHGERAAPTPARAADVDPLIGTSAGADEGFDPLEPLTLVCDNGMQRALRVSLVNEFLRAHPGAVKGDCPPAALRSSTPTPSRTIAPKPGAAPSAKPESR
ncbi:MAG TPA: hypothetical protein VGI60_16865 [Chthoniobacterales bacterium]|jgi:hypothetical protein